LGSPKTNQLGNLVKRYDGDKYVGEYKDEKPWNGTYYDKDGNIKGKYVNGVKQ